MANRATLELLVESQKATKELKKFSGSAQKSLAGVEKSFSVLKTAAIGAVGFLAGRALLGGIQQVTQAASIQEDAVNNLNTALKTSGEFSKEASRQMQDFATAIQGTTKFGDELILQQLSLAKAFGASNEQAKEVVKAATELASATGKSLPEATQQISKTLGGFAGELGEVNPAIKALTAEQLKAGEAASILIEQYGGSAAAQINTFSGALAQLQNTQGDLLEQIGFLITRNPLVINGIKALTTGFEKLIKTVANNEDAITAFVNKGFKSLLRSIPPLLKGFGFVAQTIRGVGLVLGLIVSQGSKAIRTLLEFEAVEIIARAVLAIYSSIAGALKNIIDIGAEVADSLNLDVAKGLKSAANGISDIQQSIDKLGSDPNLFQGTKDALADIQIESTKTTDQFNTFFEDIEKGVSKTVEIFDGVIDSITNVGSVASNTNVDLGGGGGSSSNSDTTETKRAKDSGIGSSILDAFRTGANFFIDLLSGEFFDRTIAVFEGIKELPAKFSDFASRLADVGLALAESLPEAFDRLIQKIPEINKKVLEIFDEIVDLFIDKGPQLFQALIDAGLEAADALVKAIPKIIDVIPDLFDRFVSSIPKLVGIILRALPKIISRIAAAIPKLVRTLAQQIVPLIQVIAENIAPIVTAIIEGMVSGMALIVVALIDELIVKGGIFRIAFALIVAIVTLIPKVVAGLVQSLIPQLQRELPKIFGGIGKAFSKNIKLPKVKVNKKAVNLLNGKFFVDKLISFWNGKNNPIKRLKDVFKDFVDKFRDTIPGASKGGRSTTQQVLNPTKSFGTPDIPGTSNFATGGLVPAGFPNDTFPARLTSGELVIPPGDTGRLSRYLDRVEAPTQDGSVAIDYDKLAAAIDSRPINVTLELNEQVLSQATLRARRAGFRGI